MSELKSQIQNDMKTAMRAKDSERLGTIRLLMAAIKQIEIDSQAELDDTGILAVINKMVKQRRDAAKQYDDADRPELANKERCEITVLETYLPKQLDESEISAAVKEAISNTGAESIRDMGKVMAVLKSQLAGAADMSKVSQFVKQHLS
jgi:uncharacterized protein YqeY